MKTIGSLRRSAPAVSVAATETDGVPSLSAIVPVALVPAPSLYAALAVTVKITVSALSAVASSTGVKVTVAVVDAGRERQRQPVRRQRAPVTDTV